MSIAQETILAIQGTEPLVGRLFDWLATKQRFTQALTIERAIKAIPGTTKAEMIAVFRELENIKLGVLLLGRKGGKTRFSWSVAPADIEKARMGELDPIPSYDSEPEDDDEDEDEDEEGLVTHTYRLRRDLVITIKLPDDLTDKEASRLGQWLATVPFDN